MPIDPRIPLGVQPVQVDTPMQTMAQVYQIRAMQDNQRYRQEQMELQRLQEQRLQEAASFALGQKQLDARAGAALAPALRSTASGFAAGFDLDDYINNVPEELRDRVRDRAQDWQAKQAKIYNDVSTGAKTQLEASRQQVQLEGEYAEEIRASGYDQGLFRATLANIKKAVPSFDDEAVFNQYGHDPAKLRLFVDGKIEAAKEDYTLSRGDVRKGPTNVLRAEGLPPAAPNPVNMQKDDVFVRGVDGKGGAWEKGNYNPETQQWFVRGENVTDRVAGQAPKATAQTTGLAPRVETTVRQLSGQFSREPRVRSAQTVAEAAQFVRTLDTNTKNPADQQALIYAFAKAMDPESVVREGEYATVQKYSQAWLEKFGFDAQRVLNSDAPLLTPEAIGRLKSTINTRYQAAMPQYRNIKTQYEKMINKATGLDDAADRLVDYGAGFPEDAIGGDGGGGGGLKATDVWDPVAKKLVPVKQ